MGLKTLILLKKIVLWNYSCVTPHIKPSKLFKMKTTKLNIKLALFALTLSTGVFVGAQNTVADTLNQTDPVQDFQTVNPTIDALKKQIAAKPDDTEALAKLATEYQNNKNWPEAVATWKQISTLLPDWAPSYYSQAYAYQSAQDNENAKLAYEQYIAKVKPEEVEANKQNLAYAYFFIAFSEQQTNPEKAKEFIAKSLQYDPSNQQAVALAKALGA